MNLRRTAPALLSLVLLAAVACKETPAAPKSTPAAPASATAAAATPVPELSPLDLEAFLENHVRRWAMKDPQNPWALAHALPIVGPDARLASGQTLVEAMLASTAWQVTKGRSYPGYLGEAPDGTPRAPHRDVAIAALYQAKVDPATTFEIGKRPTTVGALYEGALWTFESPKDGGYGQLAWSLMAMAAVPGGQGEFTNFRGLSLDPQAFVEEAAVGLEKANAFLHQAQASGGPLVKRRQGVFAEPCGGWHYYEALARWLPKPGVGQKVQPILQRVTELSSYRVHAEGRLYDETHLKAPEHLQRLLWIQELKFFGHYLEAMGVARDGGVVVRPEDIDFARRRLGQAVNALRELKAFDQMDAINAERHQSYLDLIGDSSHALQGLRAWK